MMASAGIAYLCKTCGTQFTPSTKPPEHCPICEDSRQYVGYGGQEWVTPSFVRKHHRNVIRKEEPNLYSIVTEPVFAIGQRAFLVRTAEGNLLWDSLGLLDEKTKQKIKSLGGIRAIAVSHPHYYTAMVDWSRAFGDAPIHIHTRDKQWVMRPNANVRFWREETLELFGGLRLVRTGGHFDGFQVALWPSGADGKGVVLAGDQPQVCGDRSWVTFMYSYPNYIPLGPGAAKAVADAMRSLQFDRMYGAFPGRTLTTDAKGIISRSIKRYLKAIAR